MFTPKELKAQADQARQSAAHAKQEAERARKQIADIKAAAAQAKSEHEFNAMVRRIRGHK